MIKKVHVRSFILHSVSLFFIACLYTFLYVPIITLIVFSFNKEALPAPWTGFTFFWYEQLWSESSELWTAFYNSLIVGGCTTILTLIMAIAIIFAAAQYRRMQKILGIFYANLIVPEIVLAVGLLSLFTLFKVPLGIMTLIAAHTVLGLGYAVPLLYVRYEEIDYRVLEASLDLGATHIQTLIKIVLPLLRPALLVAGMLVFIISFDDFVLSYFCTGPASQTLPVYILSMLRDGVSPVVNALSTCLLVVSSLLVLFFCSRAVRMKVF